MSRLPARPPERRVSGVGRPSSWLSEGNLASPLVYSHPGYFGKKGQRHFHYKKNQYHLPSVNLDKLWTLVSEEARKASTESKAAVIDVTKAVSSFLLNNKRRSILVGLHQGPRKGRDPQRPLHRPRQDVLQDRREAHPCRRWCLPARRMKSQLTHSLRSSRSHGLLVNPDSVIRLHHSKLITAQTRRPLIVI